jgi:hypothetical protein
MRTVRESDTPLSTHRKSARPDNAVQLVRIHTNSYLLGPLRNVGEHFSAFG